MSKIEHTYTLDLVTPMEDDKILADDKKLQLVVDLIKGHKETLLMLLNYLNEEDALELITTAIDERDIMLHRGKMIGRESVYNALIKYETEYTRREEKAKKDKEEVEKTEDVTLESPPVEEVEGSV